MQDNSNTPKGKVGRPFTRVQRTCATCGRTFETYPSVLAKGGGLYCSVPCRASNPASQPHGESHKNSKVTVDIVREIRRAYAVGDVSQKALAARFGITQGTIGAIILRRVWAHVDPDGTTPPEVKKRPDRVERVCQVCDGTFTLQPAKAAQYRTGLYCSLKCRHEGTKKPWPQRFWDKVNKNGPVPPHRPELGPCWEWIGARHEQGYGIAQGEDWHQQTYASRIDWEMVHGPVPKGQYVLHHCDNPPCVREEHLFLGTKKDNAQDRLRKGRPGYSGPKGSGELNPVAVRVIRYLWEHRLATQAAMAKAHRVSPSTIQRVIRRRVWSHVE